ncbi:MAG TPA: hypothetical protein VFA99_04140 [Acidobacteriaceae bacterium]|nr:hypothetical protein [Acidobacteriaceae bacterium]
MRRILQLAVLTLLLPAAAAMCAQITSPDVLVANPPRPPARGPAKPTDSLQWLWTFAKPEPIGRASDLRYDARFHALLSNTFHEPQAMWGPEQGHNPPLDAIIPLFLSRYGTVTAQGNRYLSIDGCVPDFCAAHGLLWVDLGTPHPLVIFAGVTWSARSHTTDDAAANYNLWLYPNREVSPDDLPIAFTEAIAHWDAGLAAAHRLVPHIAQAVLIEPNGTPHDLKPALVGANTIAPQPDTTAQDDQPAHTAELQPRN